MVHVTIDRRGTRVFWVFIHGYRKTSESWNVTEAGKEVNLAKMKGDACIVDMSDEDYMQPVDDVAREIYDILVKQWISKQAVYIVSHSIGAFYATCLANLIEADKLFSLYGMMYIDPTCKTEEYRQYLQLANAEGDPVAGAKLENYARLPDPPSFHPRVLVNVHFACDDAKIVARLFYFRRAIYANVASEIIVYPGASHMLHWDHPEKFVNGFQRMLKLTNH